MKMPMCPLWLAMSLLAGPAAFAQELSYCVDPMSAVFQGRARPRRPIPADFTGALPVRDYLDDANECAARSGRKPPSASNALSDLPGSDRPGATRLLTQAKADVLVLPFQVQGFAFDRVERSIMSADLGYALGDSSGLKIADPFLVGEALGEGVRRLDAKAVEALAGRLDARYVVSGFIGHDRQHHFTLTVQVADRQPGVGAGGGGRTWQRDWRSVSFTDERMPALVMHGMLPQVIAAIPIPRAARVAARAPQAGGPVLQLRSTLRQLASANQLGDSPATALALLAEMTPPAMEAVRDRLFAKAYVASLIGGDSPAEAQFLKAYILMELHRRPAAMELVRDLASPEAGVLRDLLDGDLTGARQAMPKVPDTLARLLLALQLRDLESTYGKGLARTVRATAQEFPGAALADWQSLTAMRADAADPWSAGDAIAVKKLLDVAFPIEGMDLRSVVAGGAIARDEVPDLIAIDLANIRHVRRALGAVMRPQCCDSRGPVASAVDVLSLLGALAEGRAIAGMSLVAQRQGRPAVALDMAARYDPLLQGSPEFEQAKAAANVELVVNGPPEERAVRTVAAAASAVAAATARPGQSRLTAAALLDMGLPSDNSLAMADAYGYDYPRRSFWPTVIMGVTDKGGILAQLDDEALRFSASDTTPLVMLARDGAPGQADAAMAALGNRFRGNPDRVALAAPTVRQTFTASAVTEKALHDALKAAPGRWEGYLDLAKYLLRIGRPPEEAATALMGYPLFHKRSLDDPVMVGNHADEAAELFYLLGDRELTRRFYRIGAGLDTGSAANLVARQRLSLFDGDFARAAALAQARGAQYGDPSGFRDYLTLLHVTGHGAEAWQAFSQLREQFQVPQLWVSALVGLRKEGRDDAAVRSWLLKPEISTARVGRLKFATRLAMWAYSTDRKPPQDLGSLVEQLDGPKVALSDTFNGFTSLPDPDTPGLSISVGASIFRRGKRSQLPQGTPIKSEMAFFADAYSALRNGDMSLARSRFDAMADHYSTERYALGYYAYAAAHSGDPDKLEQFVNQLEQPPNNDIPRFDTQLAKAFFAASHKDRELAFQSLKAAFRLRQPTGDRPVLTEYQYAEACEWLYQDTGDHRFIAELLDWSRRLEVMQPTWAWVYAVQYQYGEPGPDRVRALAMASYLDRLSPRIGKASAAERQAAKDWLAGHPPFALAPAGAPPQTT